MDRLDELIDAVARVPRRPGAGVDAPLPVGVVEALAQLDRELSIARQHRDAVIAAKRYAGQRGLRLHLGCGPQRKDGWVNIDLRRDADLSLDVRERLPFADGSVAMVYSEHFFEHLDYPDGTGPMLAESMRVLEPGGVFSVGVPDAEEILRQYAEGALPDLLRRWSREPGADWFPPWAWQTPMHMVNFFFRQWREHKYAYDFDTLARVLADAGFVDVRRRDFDATLDSEHRRDGTLYVDAVRPRPAIRA